MKEYVKCKTEGTFLTPCEGLQELAYGEFGHGKGLKIRELTNTRTREKTRNSVNINSGKYKNMFINFCPVCGVSFESLQNGL